MERKPYRRTNKAPGIRVLSTRRKPMQIELYDEDTGEWLATSRWRPKGWTVVELAPHIRKRIVRDSAKDN